MAKARNLSERERSFIDWVTRWMLETAVFDPSLLQNRVVLPKRELRQEEDFEFLTGRGCDAVMLYDCLGMVRPLQEALPQIVPRRLESLASSLERDLALMMRLVKSHTVPIIIDDDPKDHHQTSEGADEDRQFTVNLKEGSSKKKTRIVMEGTAGDLHVTPRLKEDLERKIAGYRELAQSARDEMVPRRDRLKQLCKLLPVRYVHMQTGRKHFDPVLRLLDWASWGHSRPDDIPAAGKLSKDYKAAGHYMHLFDLLLNKMKEFGYSPPIRGFKDSGELIFGAEVRKDATSHERGPSRGERDISRRKHL